jgi:hypothetical protein
VVGKRNPKATPKDSAASAQEVQALEARIAQLVAENEIVVAGNKRVEKEGEAVRRKADVLLAAAKDTLETFTREKKEIQQKKKRSNKEAVVKSEGKQAEKDKVTLKQKRNKKCPSSNQTAQQLSSTQSDSKTDDTGETQTGVKVLEKGQALSSIDGDRNSEGSIARELISEKRRLVDENKLLKAEVQESQKIGASREVATKQSYRLYEMRCKH